MPKKTVSTPSKISPNRAFTLSGLFVFSLCTLFFFNPKSPLSKYTPLFDALANNTIRISAVVLGPPVVPAVSLTETCLKESGTLAITLSWPKDINSATYTITKNGSLLADTITENTFIDRNALLNESSTYTVTAHGVLDNTLATSDPKTITPKKECPNSTASYSYIWVSSFDTESIPSLSAPLQTENPLPAFSGLTDKKNATLAISIQNAQKMLFDETRTNANGYWMYSPTENLTPGQYMFTVSAQDSDNSAAPSAKNLSFEIAEKKHSDTFRQKNPLSFPPQSSKTTRPPLDFSFSVKNISLLQKKKLLTSIKITDLPEHYVDKKAEITLTLLNENTEENIKPFKKRIGLKKDAQENQTIEMPFYAKKGSYAIRAEISVENCSVSKEKYFDVPITPAIIRLQP